MYSLLQKDNRCSLKHISITKDNRCSLKYLFLLQKDNRFSLNYKRQKKIHYKEYFYHNKMHSKICFHTMHTIHLYRKKDVPIETSSYY